ncbi:MAG: tRNA 2-thiouridine(34) synthase MnmA, partial [Candidatus Gracilibacteria bacterium]|nr:tRNA 2-thiouridine(34) synthase MnmA [Candidatus Gracilibacteria bacterium]
MKYLVGMSGGVDSSVAAVKLKKEGHEVIGVHMILWSEDMHKNKCCNTSDLLFARQVADRYEIPFYTMD